jgi:putative endonuclease
MQKFNSTLRGQAAEQQALEYLENRGLRLLDRNFRCHFGEIDLVMRDATHVIFIEVRSRQRTDYGNALESITPAKIKKLVKTAKLYLQMKKWLYKVNSRFDIIAIHPVAGDLQLEWIKNAFTVDY